MKNFKKFEETKLKPKQRKAIEMLIYQGLSKTLTAQALKITPATLSNWLNIDKNPQFVEAYEKELECADNLRKRNYRSAAQHALEKLIELVDSSDEKTSLAACKEILDRAGDKPSVEVRLPEMSGKLASVMAQIGGEGLEE